MTPASSSWERTWAPGAAFSWRPRGSLESSARGPGNRHTVGRGLDCRHRAWAPHSGDNGRWPEIQFSDFVWPSINQLVGEAARTCYGTNGAVRVPMTVTNSLRRRHPGRAVPLSERGDPLLSTPPASRWSHPALLTTPRVCSRSAIRDDDPVVFLEHKKTYRLVRGEVPDEEYTLPLGVADIKRPGRHLTIVSYGLTLHYCLEAAEQARRPRN